MGREADETRAPAWQSLENFIVTVESSQRRSCYQSNVAMGQHTQEFIYSVKTVHCTPLSCMLLWLVLSDTWRTRYCKIIIVRQQRLWLCRL
jgi:hypothetical protein